MTPKQVIEFYGSVSKAVKATGFTRQAFSKWKLQGYIPMDSQFAIMQESKHSLVLTKVRK